LASPGVTCAAPFLYTAHRTLTGSFVAAIDAGTATVAATIPMMWGSPSAIAVNPAGTRVYVASGPLEAIDATTNRVVARLGGLVDPWRLAVHPDGTHVYVGSKNDGWLRVVDAASLAVLAQVPLELVSGMAVNPSGTRLYVAGGEAQELSVVDMFSHAIIARIPLGTYSQGVAVHPDGSRVYVVGKLVNGNDAVLSVIDARRSRAANVIPLGPWDACPFDVAVHPGGRRLYVSDRCLGEVIVMETRTYRILARIPVPYPNGIAIHPAAEKAYIAHAGGISVIDLMTNEVTGTINGPPLTDGAYAVGAFLGPDSECGDDRLQATEQCDDGNTTPGDGCSPTCRLECGNGVLDPLEACDDGNRTDGDGCDTNCRLTGCGNGVASSPEECDDGNTLPGDGCAPDCRRECGNGTVDPLEACDDGNTVDGDGCDSDCTRTACGNGIRTGGESCDDGSSRAGDGCSPACRLELHEALKCYPAQPASGQGGPAGSTLVLADRFGAGTVRATGSQDVCVPAEADGVRVRDTETLLTCYGIENLARARAQARPEVVVDTRFGRQTLLVSRRQAVCVPSVEKPAPRLVQTFRPGGRYLFGWAMAAVGGNLVVGSPGRSTNSGTVIPGAAFLFHGETGELLRAFPVPSLSRFGDDRFGEAVAAAGTAILVGEPGDFIGDLFNAGSVHLFDTEGGARLHTFLNPTPAALDFFGSAVAAVGSDVVVGAPGDDTAAPDAGAAYVLDGDRSSPTFGALRHTLLSPAPAASRFGRSIAAHGSMVLLGAPDQMPEAVHMFDPRSGELRHTFESPAPGLDKGFGTAIASAGATVLVGAPAGVGRGAVYLFDGDPGSPTFGALLHTFRSPTSEANDGFGRSIAMAGTRAIIGDPAARPAGAAYLFEADRSSPTFGAVIHTFRNPTVEDDEEPAYDDRFGWAVAGVGGHVAVGSPTGIDDRGNDGPGSAHLFTFCGDGALDIGEECDDRNALDGDGCSAGCRLEPRPHLACYRARNKLGSGRFRKQIVGLADRFEAKRTAVLNPHSYCTPVDVNGSGAGDPTASLTCFTIRDAREPDILLDLSFGGAEMSIRNPFGDATLRAGVPHLLCVPSVTVGAEAEGTNASKGRRGL
jgi:cysteine-rich repeat protein/YVTN family beta-propeller protein